MRSSFASLRATYAESEGPAAPVYGTVAAVGVAAPLLVGVLTGHAAESVLVALGAFYVALAAPAGRTAPAPARSSSPWPSSRSSPGSAVR